jgi:hypothetical protein
VLDADFDTDGDGGGSIRSGQTVLTAGRASRRAAAVAGEYAAAMRADAASDQSFSAPTFEFKGHRCLFAAASRHFRELLYRPTTLAASGDPRIQLSPAVTPGAFTAVRSYIYTGKAMIEMCNAVEIVAAAAVLGLNDLMHEAVSYIVTSLSNDNFYDVRHHMEIPSAGLALHWHTVLRSLATGQVLKEADRFVSNGDAVGDECASQCNALLDACEQFFCQHANGLVVQEEFLYLPSHTLESLVQRDDLTITELAWFEAIYRWTNADWTGCVAVLCCWRLALSLRCNENVAVGPSDFHHSLVALC